LVKRTIHVTPNDKFIFPFIGLVDKHFETKKHIYFVLDQHYEMKVNKRKDIILVSEFRNSAIAYIALIKLLNTVDKIIIHGLWDKRFIRILFIQPWLMKKCYWMMWGGDFYSPEQQGWIKKQVMKRLGYLVTGTTGDYTLLKEWYGAKGQHIKCFNYPSNLYREKVLKVKQHTSINLQVGNSADPSNNHFRVLDHLSKYKGQNIKIFVPLSYGNDEYAREVIYKGKKLFGDKFIPMTTFFPIEKYLAFLMEIDIAIFAHDRQQAMGNITTLLGYGKKVYLSKESTLNGVFDEFKIKVFDSDDIDLELLDNGIRDTNMESVKANFSENSLIDALKLFLL
jgi:dTDP-N-acetylfucosamine:lipid II N-acetylfucosaminyltransferase